ncbi:MAG: hypothetical protein QOE61_29 [Micromonosporaceae bacterium]|jgi:hypothetical protein|nr:hypothetical protein [Micromonosporaceae bacterium]
MSPVITRARTSTGAGVIAMLVLVLAFGNQAYVEWAAAHAQGANAWDLLLRTLAWPKWFITSGGTASQDVIAFDVRALLLVVLVAAALGMAGANVAGGGGAFVLGWFSVILGAAIAALLTAFLTTDASLYNALQAAASASTYGLFVGWIVGLAAAATRRSAAAA